MEKDIFAIKLGSNIVIGYEKNGQKTIIKDKDNNPFFNYMIKIDDNLEINIKKIINYIIKGKFGKVDDNFNIICANEIYRIEIIKNGKIYLLEELFMKLLEKIKNVINTLINKQLNKIILIYQHLTYELLLILKRASIISRLKIINFIDINKSVRFYLDYQNIIHKNNSIVLIQFDENIQISLYDKNSIKRIFNSEIKKNDINIKFMPLKKELDEIINKNYFNYIKKFINKLTVKAYGAEEIIDKINLFNNTESEYINEITISGALYSTTFPISKECLLIFNFIDYNNNYPIEQLKILEKSYKINRNILEINIDDLEIPFEDCYYRNINIIFKDNFSNNTENIITIYYNQKNYFFCTKDIDNANSAEFIFFRTFPTIRINNVYNIDIKEKFEENQIFKRVNILNVNRDLIKLDDKPLIYYDALEPLNNTPYKIKEINLFPDTLFLIGKNLNVLSFFSKDMHYKLSYIQDKNKVNVLDLLENIDLIGDNVSLEQLIKNKKKLLEMTQECKNILNQTIIGKYQYGNIQNFNEYDINIFIKYGKYKLFEQIFYNDYKLELN